MQFISDILNAIPNSAWIGVSISGVIATLTVGISAIRSDDVQLEVANIKLGLSSQIAKAQKLNSESEKSLIVISETLQKSQEVNAHLRQQIKELKAAPCYAKNQKLHEIEKEIETISKEETSKNIQEIEEIKTELENNSQSLEQLNEELVEQENLK